MIGNRAFFIVIEGGDRSGKSTLARNIQAALDNKVTLSSFPNRNTPIGTIINTYLQAKEGQHELCSEAIHLLFSANRHEVIPRLMKQAEGGILLLDRYVPSGVAYSTAKGLDMNWCFAADQGLPKPDLILFVRIPVEEVCKRAGFGEERYERVEFQKRVHIAFDQIKERESNSTLWVDIDGTQTQEKMLQQAISAIHARMANVDLKGDFGKY